MPKSKRERKSALTQVKKKGRAVKDALVTKIREACGTFSNIYVFDVDNMKNDTMKEVREQWGDSKFFLGKNKVMQLALGKSPEEEQKPGLCKLAHHITGTRGLLFTNKSVDEVKEHFSSFRAQHFARSGFTCTGNYKLAEGTLPADRCPHPMEPLLRKLGLPTELKMGKVELRQDVDVAKKGDSLSPEQCKILQIFGVQLATFKLHLLYAYSEGVVTEVEGEAAEDDAEEEKEGEEEAIELRTAGGEGYVEGADDEEIGAGEEEEDDTDM